MGRLSNWIHLGVVLCCLSIGRQIACQERVFEKCYNVEDGLHKRSVLYFTRDGLGQFWLVNKESMQIFDGSSFRSVELPDRLRTTDIQEFSSLDDGRIYCQMKDPPHYIIDGIKEAFSALDSTKMYAIWRGQLYAYDTVRGNVQLEKLADQSVHQVLFEGGKVPIDIKSFGGSQSVILAQDGVLHLSSDREVSRVGDEVSALVGEVGNRFMIQRDSSFFLLDSSGVMEKHASRVGADFLYFQDRQDQTLVMYSREFHRYDSVDLFAGDSVWDYSDAVISPDNNTIRGVWADDFRQKMLIASYNGLCYYYMNTGFKYALYDSELPEGKFGEAIRCLNYRPADGRYYFAEEVKGVYSMNSEGEMSRVPFPTDNVPGYDGHHYATYVAEDDLLLSSTFSRTTGGHFNVYDFEGHWERVPIRMATTSFTQLSRNLFLLTGTGGKYQALLIDIDRMKIVDSLSHPQFEGRLYDAYVYGDTLLLGGENGLYRTSFSFDEKGLEIGTLERLTEDHVLDFFADRQYILIATMEGILVYGRNGPMARIDEADGLPDNQVHSIYLVNDSIIALTTQQGLVLMDRELRLLQVITRENGLSSNELNRSAICSGPNGELIVGTMNGLTVLDANVLRIKPPLTRLLVHQVAFRKEGLLSSLYPRGDSIITLPFDATDVVIEYREYDYHQNPILDKSQAEYDFWIDGYQTSLDDMNLKLGKLSPGNHVMIWSPKAHLKSAIPSMKLTLYKLHWTQQYWPYLASAAAIIGLMVWIRYQKENQRKQKEERNREKVRSRLNEVKLSALRSNMNPHFVFNALGSIQYYIQTQKTDIADSYLTTFAQLMRRYLEHSQKNSVSLSEEIELLEDYTTLERMRHNEEFDVYFEIDERLPVKELQVPTMLLQPFVENAIKHGLSGRHDGHGRLEVSFCNESEYLLCHIKDNGVGIKKTMAKKKLHKSKGTQLIKEKIQLLNESELFEIDYNTSTLTEGDVEYPGTCVLIRIKKK